MSGPRVIGRYALFDPIASGGMATVHFGRLAGAAGFARTVAIKRLHTADSATEVSSLVDEARLTSRIRHTNVVSTLDVVVDGDELFLVMDYIEGESLARLVRTTQGVPVPIAIAIVVGALRGLHAAHEATSERGKPLGIVHRDVSPQNILVGVDGVARIADFGIAHAAVRMQSTQDGVIKGKLGYLSPEQLRGEPLDRRVDVYAAGVVLWEALTGRRLFHGKDPSDVVSDILSRSIEPARSIAPDIPAELDAAIIRAIARDREDRFPSAAAMADALERAASVASTSEVAAWVQRTAAGSLERKRSHLAEIEAASGVFASPAAAPPPAQAPANEPEPPRKKSRADMALYGVTAAIVVVLIVALLRRPEAPAASPPPPPQPSSPPVVLVPTSEAPPPPTGVPEPTETSSPPPHPRPRRPAATAIDCTSPFIVDSTGVKIPRQECLKRGTRR